MAYSWYEAREPSVDRMYRPRPKLVVSLDEVVDENESESSDESVSNFTGSTTSLYSNLTTGTANTTNAAETANVFLRLRPLQRNHTYWDQMQLTSEQTLAINSQAVSNRREMEKTFTFTGIFDSEDQQRLVYQQSVKKLVENDKDTVVLTYGTSGSGKTYTILGTSENPGIVPRALYNLFGRYKNHIQSSPVAKTKAGKLVFLSDAEIAAEDRGSQAFLDLAGQAETSYDVNSMLARLEREEEVVAENLANTRVYIWVSFLEIYNEKVFDLLGDSNSSSSGIPAGSSRMAGGGAAVERRKELKVALNGEMTSVKNLRSLFVRNCEEAMSILNYGMQQVASGSTQINSRSSRSHCIFYVDVITDQPNIGFNFTQYKFGDLAGSERLKKTENMGERLKEAQHINTSLLVLSRCLDVLHGNGTKKRKDMVPFRDSKLTMLIKAALQGLDNFVMIVNMLPAQEYVEENLHVLNFASIAKQLSMKPCAELLRRQRTHRFSKISSVSTSAPDHDILIRRLDEVTHENHVLRVMLEQTEIKLQKERAERQEIIDHYKETMAKSEASKRKHDNALEEYYKYQFEQLQAKIRLLEKQREEESYSVSGQEESDDEEDADDETERQPRKNKQQQPDVVDLDSDA